MTFNSTLPFLLLALTASQILLLVDAALTKKKLPRLPSFRLQKVQTTSDLDGWAIEETGGFPSLIIHGDENEQEEESNREEPVQKPKRIRADKAKADSISDNDEDVQEYHWVVQDMGGFPSMMML